MRLHADVRGDGPPLVLLHGFTGSSATWEAARQRLARRWRTVAVDLPGHGGSPPPASGTRLDAVADALVAVLDGLGEPAACWLGYSLGGRAALHVTLRHPAHVTALVLESTSPGIADPTARAARAAADAELADTIVRDGLETFVTRWAAQPLFATQRRLPEPVRERERALRLAQRPEALAAALRALGPGVQAPLHAELRRLRPPVLCVAGADDVAYVAHAHAMAAAAPHASVHVVAGAGHAVHLERPDAFWQAVETFLTTPSAARGATIAGGLRA